jgi:hypothetical protein
MPRRMIKAILLSLLLAVLLETASAQSCTCSCCTGNSCSAKIAGTFTVSSKDDCSTSACNLKYPSVCPNAGSSGSSSASFVSASSSSTPSSSSSSTPSSYSGLATRTSVSPSDCVAPTNCVYQCSASYTFSVSGSTAKLTPGIVPGCTCYTGTGLLVDNEGMISFQDGSQSVLTVGNCVVSVVATTQGVICSGAYAVTGTSGCPASPSSAPSGGATSFSSASAIKTSVGIVVAFMAAASVAANFW